MTVERTRNTGRVRIPASWYLVHCFIIAASVIAAVLLWDQIPERLAVHYDIGFHPDRYEDKGGSSVFMLNIIQLFLLLLLMGVERVVTSDAAALGRGMPQEKQRQYRYANGLLLYVLSLVLIAFFSYVQATILYSWPIAGAIWGTIALVFLIFAGIAGLIVYVRKLGVDSQNDDVDGGDGKGEGKWIAGGLYYNPQDRALLVPKRYGTGWTVNCGRPLGWVLMLAILAVPFIIVGLVVWVK